MGTFSRSAPYLKSQNNWQSLLKRAVAPLVGGGQREFLEAHFSELPKNPDFHQLKPLGGYQRGQQPSQLVDWVEKDNQSVDIDKYSGAYLVKKNDAVFGVV